MALIGAFSRRAPTSCLRERGHFIRTRRGPTVPKGATGGASALATFLTERRPRGLLAAVSSCVVSTW